MHINTQSSLDTCSNQSKHERFYPMSQSSRLKRHQNGGHALWGLISAKQIKQGWWAYAYGIWAEIGVGRQGAPLQGLADEGHKAGGRHCGHLLAQRVRQRRPPLLLRRPAIHLPDTKVNPTVSTAPACDVMGTPVIYRKATRLATSDAGRRHRTRPSFKVCNVSRTPVCSTLSALWTHRAMLQATAPWRYAQVQLQSILQGAGYVLHMDGHPGRRARA